jgi:hypothetical protein
MEEPVVEVTLAQHRGGGDLREDEFSTWQGNGKVGHGSIDARARWVEGGVNEHANFSIGFDGSG